MLISVDELMELEATESPSLIGAGLLPIHGLMEIVGKTGIGKSVIAADIAMSLILGESLFGAHKKRNDGSKGEPYFPVHKECKVLYFDAEVGLSGLKERMTALLETRCPGVKLGSRLQFVTEHTETLSLLGKANNQLGLLNVRKLILEAKPEDGIPYAVVFDPLGDFHEVDENDSSMRLVFRHIKQLQAEIGFAAIVPHHESDRVLSGPLGPIHRTGTSKSRGHSSITQVMDTVITLDREQDDDGVADIKIEWPKVRHGARPPSGMLLVDYEKMYVEWYGPARGQGLQHRLNRRKDYLASKGIIQES